ncbi:MAG: DNA polymerase III subunit delta [Chlorobiota bacterium]
MSKSSSEIPKVLLLFGEESFLIDEMIKEIYNAALESGISSNSIEKVDGSEINEQIIVDMANNLSLISPEKLLIINNFDVLYKNKRKSFAGFVNYIKNPNPNTKLILVGAPSRLNGISKDLNSSKKAASAQNKISKLPLALKEIFEKNYYKEFSKIYDNQFATWTVQRAKKYKKVIDLEVANLLSLSCNSIREIDNEIKKINIFSPDSDRITVEQVEEIVGVNKDNNVFELSKSVGSKNLTKSINISDNLLSQSNQSVLILITLTRYFLKLFKLSDEIKNTNNKFQLAGKIGVNPFFMDDYLNSLKFYSPNQIETNLNTLAKADEELKSSSINNKLLIQRTLTNLINHN